MPINYNTNVFSYYIGQCRREDWYKKYYNCGSNGDGSVFKFLSTNYRDLNSFAYYFNVFKDNCMGIPRSNWDRSPKTGEEVAKQYVVNLRQASLFSSEKDEHGETIFYMTQKGKVFEKMLQMDFNKNERKFLIFLFIVNSPFVYTPKYILKQSQMIWDFWADADLDTNDLKNQMRDLVSRYDGKFLIDSFNYDVLWYMSFYSDPDFLQSYSHSSQDTIKHLHETTIYDYQNANKHNVLAYKFKGTNFSSKTLNDSLMMIYMSESVLSVVDKNCDFQQFYRKLINAFNGIVPIDKEKIFDFISENDDVFRVIYSDVISSADDFTETYIPRSQDNLDYLPVIMDKKFDTTSMDGVQKYEHASTILKTMAKDQTHYHCACEPINHCHYFTSKEDNNNYLEIHHFVPREFSCDFEDTLEFLDNYVPLCPSCHREIHFGTDDEKKKMILFLFEQREKGLKDNGINIDLTTLYKYYKIDK